MLTLHQKLAESVQELPLNRRVAHAKVPIDGPHIAYRLEPTAHQAGPHQEHHGNCVALFNHSDHLPSGCHLRAFRSRGGSFVVN